MNTSNRKIELYTSTCMNIQNKGLDTVIFSEFIIQSQYREITKSTFYPGKSR